MKGDKIWVQNSTGNQHRKFTCVALEWNSAKISLLLQREKDSNGSLRNVWRKSKEMQNLLAPSLFKYTWTSLCLLTIQCKSNLFPCSHLPCVDLTKCILKCVGTIPLFIDLTSMMILSYTLIYKITFEDFSTSDLINNIFWDIIVLGLFLLVFVLY